MSRPCLNKRQKENGAEKSDNKGKEMSKKHSRTWPSCLYVCVSVLDIFIFRMKETSLFVD